MPDPGHQQRDAWHRMRGVGQRNDAAGGYISRTIAAAVAAACLSRPDTACERSHGMPTFRVCGKSFVSWGLNQHGDSLARLVIQRPSPGASAPHMSSSSTCRAVRFAVTRSGCVQRTGTAGSANRGSWDSTGRRRGEQFATGNSRQTDTFRIGHIAVFVKQEHIATVGLGKH